MNPTALTNSYDATVRPEDAAPFLVVCQGRINALILDDCKFDRRRLMRDCAKAGLDIAFTETATIPELTQALDDAAFDLIFIDYRLTEEDGLVALQKIADHPWHMDCATIMIAGDAETDVAVRAIQSGCSDFIEKSRIDANSIRRAVINAVQKSTMKRQIATTHAMNLAMLKMIEEFADDCLNDMKPLLSRMLEQIRGTDAETEAEPDDAAAADLETSCRELWDFLQRIEDHAGELRGRLVVPETHDRT